MLQASLKIAWKVLIRKKFFTFVTLFGISFTLLILLLVTAALDHVFASHPPEVNARRTLLVEHAEMKGPKRLRQGSVGYPFHDRYVRRLSGVAEMSIVSGPRTVVSYPGGNKLSMSVKLTDGAYWRILEFDFLEGGPYSDHDDSSGRQVAVISESTRDRYFGPGVAAVGRAIDVDGRSFEVVGVVPTPSRIRIVAFSDLWIPIGSQASGAYRNDWESSYSSLILLPEGADIAAFQRRFQEMVAAVELPPDGYYDELHAAADTYFEAIARAIFGSARSSSRAVLLRLLIVLAMVLFMLLPAINLVNLNISRVLERAPEIGIRKAFGASTRMLSLQFLVENLFVTTVGAIIAWALASAVLGWLRGSGLVPYAPLALNLRVLGWGMLVTLVFSTISGIYPAWRMSRLEPVKALSGRF